MTEEYIAVAYPALYRATRRLMKDFLDALRAVAGDPPQWPQARFYDVIVNAGGGTQIGVKDGNDYAQTLRAAWMQLAAIPSLEGQPSSYSAVTAEMEELKRCGKTAGFWRADLVEGFAYPIVHGYVSSGFANEPFSEKEFAKLYDGVESYLSSSVLTVRAFLDLGDLTGDLSPIVLDSRRRIVTLDKDTVQRMLVRAYRADTPLSLAGHFLMGQTSSVIYAQAGQLALELTFQYPKDQFSELGLILKKEADEAVASLRLSQPGTGSIQLLDYEHVGFVPDFGRYGFGREPVGVRFAYEIDKDVEGSVVRRWPDSSWVAQQLFSSPSPLSTALRIAIERFNSSFEKRVPADRLLDYIIALEALCSRENDAVTYRVALRVAALIGKDVSDRGSVLRVVSEAYDERSRLAHGRASKLTGSDAESVNEYLLKVEAVLLRTIHAFVRAEKRAQKKMRFSRSSIRQ